MGSKERIIRYKEDTRRKIVTAALGIIKCKGCDALSMRELADEIEYTAPIIYQYFKNKEALYAELARDGYLQLAATLCAAKSTKTSITDQILAMWLAYWNYAFAHKELYQLMFGVAVGCSQASQPIAEANNFAKLFKDAITELTLSKNLTDDKVQKIYYTYWSVVHGLIAINMIKPEPITGMNQQILSDAINGITASIKN